jgi:hypothetical protein
MVFVEILPYVVEPANAVFLPPKQPANLKELVEALNDATPSAKRTDLDNDGIFDTVETVIGTDFNNADSDFDFLDDYFEVVNGSNPLNPDSNNDGLPDYNEVYGGLSQDMDCDNIPNVWDSDNDGDGVNDEVDLSPFSFSSITPSGDLKNKYYFRIQMNGKPTCITLQLKPKNSEHLKLYSQLWDWPYDVEGLMRDMDNSTEDVKVIPLLNVVANVLPDPLDAAEYGILVTDEGMQVPVLPVWENGAIVAFTGQLFYNVSSPMLLTLETELIWQVIGLRDEEAVAFSSWSPLTDGYLTLEEDNYVRSRTFVDDNGYLELKKNQVFEWINLGEDKVALKIQDGPYLSVASDGSIIGEYGEIGDAETFEVLWQAGVAGYSEYLYLKAGNGLVLSFAADGTLIANIQAETVYDSNIAQVFFRRSQGFLGEWTILATYKPEREPFYDYDTGFMLTGFTVRDSYGADVGLFYSDDADKTLSANSALAYDFLRVSTNHLLDMPMVLQQQGVDVSTQMGSFSNSEQALVNMSNEMLPDALKSLPPNQTLPVIIATEENFTMVEMSDAEGVSGNMFRPFFVDLSAQELLTSKTLKNNFYNTTSERALELYEIMFEINSLSMDERARLTALTLVLAWNTGEQIVRTQKLANATDELFPEWLELAIPIGFEAICQGADGLDALKIYKELTRITLELEADEASKALFEAARFEPSPARRLELFRTFKGFKNWVFHCTSVCKVKSGFYAGVKGIKAAAKTTIVLDIAAAVVDVGLSIWEAVSLSEQIGGEAGLKAAIAYGIISSLYYVSYATLLVCLSAIPYVGWLLALGIAIADLIGNFSDKLMEKLKEDWTPHPFIQVEPTGINVGAPKITISDEQNNGLTIGDQINVTVLTESKIVVTEGPTEWGGSYMLQSSFYRPWIKILYMQSGPSFRDCGFDFDENGWTPRADIILTHDTDWNWKTEEYETSTWITPMYAMPNFPVYIELDTFYAFPYVWEQGEEKHLDFISNYDNVSRSEYATLYFDVLPINLKYFANWVEITPLDQDFDGVRDSDEGNSDPSMYDTDGDGLNDKYEYEIGTNPSNSDTDGDGLSDKFEGVYGTNATNNDTDGDGLNDYFEISGWNITFNYNGDPAKSFTMPVYSDPNLFDTDGDGLTDKIEYWSCLNPRSKDSNGDGIKDADGPLKFPENLNLVQACNMSESSGEYVAEKKSPGKARVDIPVDPVTDMAVDANGNLYVLRRGPTTSKALKNYNFVSKYDSNGIFINSWCNSSVYIDSRVPRTSVWLDPAPLRKPHWSRYLSQELASIAVDTQNEWLYIASPGHILRTDLNGKAIGGEEWATLPLEYIGHIVSMDVDAEGYVYAAFRRHLTTYKSDILGSASMKVLKIHPNGTLVDSWGGYGASPEQFNDISGIAVDEKNGFVYVADIATSSGSDVHLCSRIAKFTTEGEYLRDFTDGFNAPRDVAVDADGFVYVADAGNNRIVKFYSNGLLANLWGTSGTEDGNFISPLKLTVDANAYVYVGDESYPYGYYGSNSFWIPPTNKKPEFAVKKEWYYQAPVFCRIQKFSQIEEEKPAWEDFLPDRD